MFGLVLEVIAESFAVLGIWSIVVSATFQTPLIIYKFGKNKKTRPTQDLVKHVDSYVFKRDSITTLIKVQSKKLEIFRTLKFLWRANTTLLQAAQSARCSHGNKITLSLKFGIYNFFSETFLRIITGNILVRSRAYVPYAR